MVIICDYCGEKIVTTKHKTCPCCGASFDTNKKYQKDLEESRKVAEMKLKLEEKNYHSANKNHILDIERKKNEIEATKNEIKNHEKGIRQVKHTKKVTSALSVILLIPIVCIVFCCISSTAIYTFYDPIMEFLNNKIEELEKLEGIESTEETPIIDTEIKEPEIETFIATMNEKVVLDNYSVTLIELKEDDEPIYIGLPNGYISVKISLLVENNLEHEQLIEEKVYVLADGFIMSGTFGEKSIKFYNYLAKNSKTTVEYRIAIPANTKELNLKFGEQITFVFDNTLNQGE